MLKERKSLSRIQYCQNCSKRREELRHSWINKLRALQEMLERFLQGKLKDARQAKTPNKGK